MGLSAKVDRYAKLAVELGVDEVVRIGGARVWVVEVPSLERVRVPPGVGASTAGAITSNGIVIEVKRGRGVLKSFRMVTAFATTLCNGAFNDKRLR